MNFIRTKLRSALSINCNRYVDGEYNIDLTYITNRIIAMGFPGDSMKKMFGNNRIQKIAQYLDQYHHGTYLIFNLSRTSYDESKFDNNIMVRFYFIGYSWEYVLD
jgi:phosphatidylinositol-3,4,5-trisphosphate 3-phosphatase/dual-specificity protein phosphatase PTEN